MFAVKTTWIDTIGLASASQLVDRTSSPVIDINDAGTAPGPRRKLYITRVVEHTPIRRSREIKFSRVKRRRKTTKTTAKTSKKS
jgi:hypothetical protein